MRRLLATLTAFLVLIPAALAYPPPARAAWTWPVSGDVITPYRNGTDPYASGQHRGIDIAAPVGAGVVAAAAGEVLFAGTAGSSGLTISIRTSDGYDTSYLHLSSVAVRAGTRVGAGDRIGAVGTTGTRSATAPHLHFGVRDAGTRHAYHDPLTFLPSPTPPAAPESAPQAAPESAAAPPAAAPVPVALRNPTPLPRSAPAPRARHAPARVQGNVPAARPRNTPALRRAPARHARPAPRQAPGAAHTATPAPSARVRANHSLHQAPGRGDATRAAPEYARRGVGGRSAALERAHPAAGASLAARASRSRSPLRRAAADAADAASRPNLGWALACAGVLLAGGILGLADGGRRSTRRGRTRVLAAPRALLGRR